MHNNTQGPELKTETNFKGWCSDLEGYIFDLGLLSSEIFVRTINEPERYLGVTYKNICQPAIINETPETPPNPDMPTITPHTGVKYPKTDAEMTYFKKKNIENATYQKLRKKDLYKTDMKNIYNLIVGQTNKQLQEKSASDATLQATKTSQYPIGYLITLKKPLF